MNNLEPIIDEDNEFDFHVAVMDHTPNTTSDDELHFIFNNNKA